MQSSINNETYPATEEDLEFPDESNEFFSELEVIEQKREKFERRRNIKNINKL